MIEVYEESVILFLNQHLFFLLLLDILRFLDEKTLHFLLHSINIRVVATRTNFFFCLTFLRLFH